MPMLAGGKPREAAIMRTVTTLALGTTGMARDPTDARMLPTGKGGGGGEGGGTHLYLVTFAHAHESP